jgi:hypothetical protein
MGVSTSLLTFEEFEQLPDEPGKLELLDGELIRLPPPKFDHMEIADQLCDILKQVLAGPDRPSRHGRAYVEMGYKILGKSVAAARRERFARASAAGRLFKFHTRGAGAVAAAPIPKLFWPDRHFIFWRGDEAYSQLMPTLCQTMRWS